MTPDLFRNAEPVFAATRSEALSQLETFIPLAGRYGRDRNDVVPGHPHVSKLSPAIRHRLLLESECAAAPRRRYAASTLEKFTQEIYWRRYWKSWLSLRPQVWDEYLSGLSEILDDPSAETIRQRAALCEAGEGPIAIMNHFAHELVATGYLHNHARMWFAGWWIHVEGLPWQLGADFFYRHLLDGDPASNTLSWRWVAGLQTLGKTYLPRRSNLEKYLAPELLNAHRKGIELLENPQARLPSSLNKPSLTRPTLLPSPPARERLGVWIHEEDLVPEAGPLAELRPQALLTTADLATWTKFRYPERKTAWLRKALTDAAQRAETAFGLPSALSLESPFLESVVTWANEHQLQQVAILRPEVGPLHDQLPALHRILAAADIELLLLDRPEDLALRPLATAGFFGFWEKTRKRLLS